MIRTALALALAHVTPSTPPHASNVPEAEIVVLATAGPADPLAGLTMRLLETLEADGRLVYVRPSFDGEVVRHCLTEDPNPTAERRDCVRTSIPARDSATPLVVVLLGHTRERGSYQRMECIGPAGEGHLRSIYVRDFDHPRPDVSGGTRNSALQCIEQALAPRERLDPIN
ncbi:MAG: hypothetical protein K2X07_13720 [Caulobacteraceae bacterium]|nr:hypothetical protein [Caulobacteraceae bacterium]